MLQSMGSQRVGHDWATELNWFFFKFISQIQIRLLQSIEQSFLYYAIGPLTTKVHLWLDLVKAMVFLVVMYRCKSWTIKKAECQRIDAFELWCWRRFLRIPWTARRSNQSILKEINFEYSLEALMLKLKLQYFGHLIRRADSLEKTLMLGGLRAGGEWGSREWDGWMASSVEQIWVWANSER